MNLFREDIKRSNVLLGFALILWLLSFSPLFADSEAAIKELRDHNAEVRWVTEGGFLEGHPIPLREKDYYYSVTINEHWTGGNRGLAWLRDVPRLKVLIIGDAPGIDDKGLAQISRLSDLEELSLVRLGLSDKGLGYLDSMPHLKSLHLQRLPITNAALTGLSRMATLERISLFWLKDVGDKTVIEVEGLPCLKELILARTGVSDLGLQHLNRRLESLNLFETNVTDNGLKSLELLKKLKHLNLTGTRVSDKGLSILARLPDLESVYLGRTDVTDDGIATLQKTRGASRPINVIH